MKDGGDKFIEKDGCRRVLIPKWVKIEKNDEGGGFSGVYSPRESESSIS